MSNALPPVISRAQKALRPKLTPKSPLRRSRYDANLDSPTATSSELSQSTASSLSGHGSCNTGLGFESPHIISFSGKSSIAHSVRIGNVQVSLPLLLIASLALLIGSTLLRALVTFSTSLLRLFVLFVAIVAFLVFSNRPSKQSQKIENVKAPPTTFTMPLQITKQPEPVEETPVEIASIETVQAARPPQAVVAPSVVNTTAYTSHPYGNGYGHSRQSVMAPSIAAVSPPSHIHRTHDGRTRQLLQVNST